jgi:hypothetical protein
MTFVSGRASNTGVSLLLRLWGSLFGVHVIVWYTYCFWFFPLAFACVVFHVLATISASVVVRWLLLLVTC